MSKQTTINKEHTTWTERMDSAFIQALVEQQEAGNRINEICYPQRSSGAKKLTSRKRKVEVVDKPVPAPAPSPEPESFEKSIMNTFSDIANVMRECNKAFENRDYTCEAIENRLEPMGLEPEELANACLYLSRNQSDARIVFSSSMKIRMIFLKKMMSTGGK
ncbi:hypothetical protein LXL04_008684 [Taraxacum kok-saghyz]